jgi:hypothetical protein
VATLMIAQHHPQHQLWNMLLLMANTYYHSHSCNDVVLIDMDDDYRSITTDRPRDTNSYDMVMVIISLGSEEAAGLT